MSVSPEVKQLTSIKQHRRTVRRQMILPVFLVGILILLFIIALIMPFSPLYLAETEDQVSIVSNLVVSLLVLCPTVLCLLMLFVILVFANVGLHMTQNYTAKQMRRVQVISRDVAEKVANTADNLSEKSISYNARFAFFNRIFNIFDQPTNDEIDSSDEPEGNSQDD